MISRRNFLLGSAAALVTKLPAPGNVEFVEVAQAIDVEATRSLSCEILMEDYMSDTLAAWSAKIDRQIYEAFFYGDGVGAPLGILTNANPIDEREKPAADAIAAMFDAGDADLRGYEHLFSPNAPDPSVLTLENLKEAMAKLDLPPRRGKSQFWMLGALPIA